MGPALRAPAAGGVVVTLREPAGSEVHATARAAVTMANPPAAAVTMTATRQLVSALNQLVGRSPMALTASVDQLAQAGGGSVGVTLIELGGATRVVWCYSGGQVCTAASTYKLAALMMEAQNIAAGATDPNGAVCYQDADYEAGWYDDYADGACFTRNELAQRAGLVSDNTAGHMLVRDLRGAGVLNPWAASARAPAPLLFPAHPTTASDLAG